MDSESGKVNILVLLPPSHTESFEIVLARIVDLKEKGIPFSIGACDGKIKGCVANPFGLPLTCYDCKSVRNKALKLFSLSDNTIEINSCSSSISASSHYTNLQKEIDECSLAGAESTILTFYRRTTSAKSQASLREWISNKIKLSLHTYSTYFSAELGRIVSAKSFSRVEFFNGRISPYLAVRALLQSMNIEYGIIEVTGSQKRLTLFENCTPHDLDKHKEIVSSFFDKRKSSINADDGKLFFTLRRNGRPTDQKSFTSNQHKGALVNPVGGKKVLAIYTSSADEMLVAGNQWFTQSSIDQTSFIKSLAREVSSDFIIYVRMHPNQDGDKTGATKRMVEQLSEIKDINLIIPDSPASSYELLDISSCVLTFGSTMGLEATYWGKPSILCGRALWEDMNIAYQAHDMESTLNLLNDTSLQPKPQDNAILMGCFYMQGIGFDSHLSISRLCPGYAVNGISFLPLKRMSISYALNRAIDKVLRFRLLDK